MKPCKYQIKSGRFEGLWHVRIYLGIGRYKHLTRVNTEKEADARMKQWWKDQEEADGPKYNNLANHPYMMKPVR